MEDKIDKTLSVYQKFQSKITEYIPNKTCIQIVKSLIPVDINGKYCFSSNNIDKLINDGLLDIDKEWFKIKKGRYNCICRVDLDNNYLFETIYKPGKTIIIGAICLGHIESYLSSIKIESNHLINKKCRGCDKYVITKEEHKIIINSYYCKDCKYKERRKGEYSVLYKCGHRDIFDVNNYKICITCKTRQEVVAKKRFKEVIKEINEKEKERKEKLWNKRLKKYKNTGQYKRCIICRKQKQLDHHTKCNPCKIEILKKKEEEEKKKLEAKKERDWQKYLDKAISTGLYSKCIECRNNKRSDQWEKCYKCNMDKCPKCNNDKPKNYNTCYNCKFKKK